MPRLTLYSFLLLLLLLQIGAMGQRVLDKNKRKPKWVENTPVGFLVGCATSNSIDLAKEGAVNSIREKISTAISSNVKSEFNQTVRESSNGTERAWSEEVNSSLIIESQLAGTLSGISESLASDLFWEKLSSNNSISYRCCILYEFSKNTLQEFIAQNEINRLKIESKKSELISQYEACSSISDLNKLRNSLKTQSSVNDPLYGPMIASFESFLRKETEGISPRLEQVYPYSAVVAFKTASGKNILTNAIYQIDGYALQKNNTPFNTDSILFNNAFSPGVNTAKIIIEYAISNKAKTEEIYFKPINVSESLKLLQISTQSLDSENQIHCQLEYFGVEEAVFNSIVINGNGIRLEFTPTKDLQPIKQGVNRVQLVSSNSQSAKELLKKIDRLFDVKINTTTSSGNSLVKEFFNFQLN